MKSRALTTAVLFLAACAVPPAALSKVGGGDVTYTPKGVGKVVFQHDLHVNVKGQKCDSCHYKTFQMRSGGSAYKMDMTLLTKGQFCGSCHNGKKSFDVKEAMSCKRCHAE